MRHPRIVVGERLRAARVAKGLRQADVAHAVGVSVPFVCDVEAGNRRITSSRRESFARALGLSVLDVTELDPTTLSVVEERLRVAGGCGRAVRVVQEMIGLVDSGANLDVDLCRGKTPDSILRLLRRRGPLKLGEIAKVLHNAGRDVSYAAISQACSRLARVGELRRIKGAQYDVVKAGIVQEMAGGGA